MGVLETYDARTGRWMVKAPGGQIWELTAQNLILVSAAGSSVSESHSRQEIDTHTSQRRQCEQDKDLKELQDMLRGFCEDAQLKDAQFNDDDSTEKLKLLKCGGTDSKFCMDPRALVTGTFGGIDLFDSTLEEQLGPADPDPLRAIYAEHCLMPDSNAPYRPTNNPTLVTTPKLEFEFVVGSSSIDAAQGQWKLKPASHPSLYPACMVEGRNCKSIEALLATPEAKAAQLLDVEIIALRLGSGPQHDKYNTVLRGMGKGDDVVGNRYATTIQVIMSSFR